MAVAPSAVALFGALVALLFLPAREQETEASRELALETAGD